MRQFFLQLILGKRIYQKLNKSIDNALIYQDSSQNDLMENYLFDFKNYSGGYGGNGMIMPPTRQNPSEIDGEMDMSNDSESNSKKTKLAIKPIDVLKELETIPTPFSLNLINEKISILKDKEKLIVQKYAKREISALIERLDNRKKYNEFKSFFDEYQNTNDEKINNILEKYDLVMKTSDIFVPEFPDEAIKTMQAYTEKMLLICNKKPIFYVIAEPDKFREAYKQRDPILLVQSPFGFYWQILGAWDKEMLILSEL